MNNKTTCPAKGSWMCQEVDCKCHECALAHSFNFKVEIYANRYLDNTLKRGVYIVTARREKKRVSQQVAQNLIKNYLSAPDIKCTYSSDVDKFGREKQTMLFFK